MAEQTRLGDGEIDDWRLEIERPIPHSPIPQSPTLQSPISYLLIALSLLLAALLRFDRLDASSLWNDEGNSWAMLGRTFGEIATAAAADIHPPGYYWLLKLWSLIFGDSALAMRSLSATLGVLLVALIAAIAHRAVRTRPDWRWFPPLAALVAAVNPFQIYYSQEARMYLLLAVEAAGLFLALLWMVEIEDWRLEIGRLGDWRIEGSGAMPARISPTLHSPLSTLHSPLSTLHSPLSTLHSPNLLIPQSLFIFFGIAGLWTHYSFPIVLAAAGLAFVIGWGLTRRRRSPRPAPVTSLVRYLVLNLLVLLAFLPWLPTALDRVLNWPKGGVEVGAVDGLALTLRTLLFGPLPGAPAPLWPWLLLAAALPLIGLVALRRSLFAALMAGLWLLLPVAMMFGLGLFSDAFLKFLLVAAPAWSLLVAAAPWLAPRPLARGLLAVGVAGFAVVAALAVLPAYYADAHARDNYQGIAHYLAAVGNPATDLVVLDAPGQQEVWRYYDPGLPVLALPVQRPPDAGDVAARLAAATADKRRVYALFWATDEADPEQSVERWLDANAFKAVESWQGNLRFATYALAHGLQPAAQSPVRWENGMILGGVELPTPAPQRVAPGDAALVRLWWLAETPLTAAYKVSVQLLDARDQVIAQHDRAPGGDALPTDAWTPGARIVDNHGIAIPFGTPPGLYRLMVVVYDAATGERVKQFGQEMLALGAVAVERAQTPPPTAVVPMQHRVEKVLGPVRLVGYDLHRRGFAHAPATPLQPGDVLHLTLYWQAPDPLPAEWPADLAMTLRLGDQQVTAPLAGGRYPTAQWAAGELVRGEFDLVYTGAARGAALELAGVTLTLAPLPAP